MCNIKYYCRKSPGGLGQDHVHYEALPEIIIFKAVVLPNDTDILYKDDHK